MPDQTPAQTAVSTPDALADQLAEMLGDLPDHQGTDVLEPSAGDGALVAAVRRRFRGVWIDAVEPNPVRRNRITGATGVLAMGFEQFHRDHPDSRYEAVVMHPPWAMPETANPRAYVHHVRMALHHLMPGGRLLAIVPADVLTSRERRVAWLRELVKQGDGTITRLPAGSVRPAGINLPAALINLTSAAQGQ